jgi:hypothetical protein
MGNSTLPTVSDKLNIMASIHNRKLIAALSRELKEKDIQIQELRENITSLENKLMNCLFKQRSSSFNLNRFSVIKIFTFTSSMPRLSGNGSM